MIEYHIRDNQGLALSIAQSVNIEAKRIIKALELLDEGNTIPFIARYRKDVTGALDDEELRIIVKNSEEEKALDERRVTIFNTLNDLGIEDDKLTQDILSADSMSRLEDLYRPYKPKKKTRASEAIRRGLTDLANLIMLHQPQDILVKAASLAMQNCDELKDYEMCVSGALDILAQNAADDAKLRDQLKKYYYRESLLQSSNKVDEETVYQIYYDFKVKLNKLKDYQTLAINRGVNNNILKVEFVVDEEAIKMMMYRFYHILNDESYTDNLLKMVADDAFKRLICPSIENEVYNKLKEDAQTKALSLFGANLKNALLVPPMRKHIILALDPGYRNGCKWAVVDEMGKCLETGLIFVVEPLKKLEQANKILKRLVDEYKISLCVIGNGTACRETEEYFSDFLSINNISIPYLLVDESGASVYSVTKLAASELPDVPLNNRSAVSLARRVQDPLAELVKIDPKAIGVGQYQHDLNQKALENELGGVVESCVNKVGVNLNTASISLLAYVSGLSKSVAENIVNYRNENGAFKSRIELNKVKKLGPKAFEQCAGFLRVNNEKEPLDNTAIHPESYQIAKAFIKHFNLKLNNPTNLDNEDLKAYALKNNIGLETLIDINEAIAKPERDIRDSFPAPKLVAKIKKLEDLVVGEVLVGVIRNVTAFGAFVDLGVHQDGLVHISELANKFVKDPMDVVAIGQQVRVKVLDVDVKKHRIQLSIKQA